MTLGLTRNRAKPRWLALAGIVILLLGLAASAVLAVHDEGVFELEGNAVAGNTGVGTGTDPANPESQPAGGDDWDAIYHETSLTVVNSTIVTDTTLSGGLAGAGDSILTGGSTKDINDLGSWLWKETAVTSVQDKDDIEHAFAAQYIVDKSGGKCGTAGAQAECTLLYFGADRFSNSGDSVMGFWFFRGDVGTDGPDASGNGTFTGTHTARNGSERGDILVVSDFRAGGKAPSIQVYEWVDAGGSASTHLDLIAGSGTGFASCTQAPPEGGKDKSPVPPVGADDNFCATANQYLVTSPWPFEAKSNSGGTSGDGGSDTIFGVAEFMEGGINMTALGLGETCFSSFMAESRASHSPTSTLSDFALGSFGSCTADIQIGNDGVNEIGQTHNVTATVHTHQNGSDGLAPDGTTIDFNIVSGPGSLDADSCDTAGGTGSCTVHLTSSVPGVTKVHASSTVAVGDQDIFVETDGEGDNSGDLTKTWVDANIAITGTGTNEVGVSHTFTVTVKKNLGDGSGYVAADNGHVDVTLTGSNGITGGDISVNAASSTCDDAGDNLSASGTCVIVFSSAKAGQISGDATVTIPKSVFGTAADVVRDTDSGTTIGAGTGGSETDAVKTYVDANIAITGTGTNEVGVSHTFTVTVQQNLGDGSGYVAADNGHVVVTLTGSNGITSSDIVVDTATSTCDDAGDNLSVSGTCIIVFKSDVAGQITGDASVTIPKSVFGTAADVVRDTDSGTTIGAGTGGSETDAVKTYVDARISIGPDDTNSIGEAHTFTVHVESNDGVNGWQDASGVVVTVTFDPSDPGTVDASACTTGTDSSGECDVVINSAVAGTFTAHAAADVSVGGKSLHRETDDADGNSGDATKTYVAGSIVWHKVDGNGDPLGGATFEVCRVADLDSSDGTYTPVDIDPITLGNQPDCFTVLDNDSTDSNAADGEFYVGGLILGQYTVEETIPPAGYHIGNPPGAGPFAFPDMTIENPDVERTTAFVNIKAYRIIIMTCDDISHELVVSTVDLDGDGTDFSPVSSMSSSELQDWALAYGITITDAQVCGDGTAGGPSLGGDASFGDLPDGTYNPRINVPQ